ncbi:MAG: hypothetical protein OEZ25_05310 [Candidatus Bathyarchaeota archaeon]|nr:hypothetical protein [Candidatus Bathyarchaeota archaeon]
MSRHDEMVRRIESVFAGAFKVSTRNNNLPRFRGIAYRDKSVYRPDVIFHDKRSGEITHIIEVETSKAGKSVVGSAILADYCIGDHIIRGENNQSSEPHMVFVFLGENPRIELVPKRLNKVEEMGYLKHLKQPILICRDREAIEIIRSTYGTSLTRA